MLSQWLMRRDRRRHRQHLGPRAAGPYLQAVRRRAPVGPGRHRHPAPPGRAAVHPHAGSGRGGGEGSGRTSRRRHPSGHARVSGPAHRRQRRTGRTGARAGSGRGDAGARRAAGRRHLPFAGRSHRQGLPDRAHRQCAGRVAPCAGRGRDAQAQLRPAVQGRARGGRGRTGRQPSRPLGQDPRGRADRRPGLGRDEGEGRMIAMPAPIKRLPGRGARRPADAARRGGGGLPSRRPDARRSGGSQRPAAGDQHHPLRPLHRPARGLGHSGGQGPAAPRPAAHFGCASGPGAERRASSDRPERPDAGRAPGGPRPGPGRGDVRAGRPPRLSAGQLGRAPDRPFGHGRPGRRGRRTGLRPGNPRGGRRQRGLPPVDRPAGAGRGPADRQAPHHRLPRHQQGAHAGGGLSAFVQHRHLATGGRDGRRCDARLLPPSGPAGRRPDRAEGIRRPAQGAQVGRQHPGVAVLRLRHHGHADPASSAKPTAGPPLWAKRSPSSRTWRATADEPVAPFRTAAPGRGLGPGDHRRHRRQPPGGARRPVRRPAGDAGRRPRLHSAGPGERRGGRAGPVGHARRRGAGPGRIGRRAPGLRHRRARLLRRPAAHLRRDHRHQRQDLVGQHGHPGRRRPEGRQDLRPDRPRPDQPRRRRGRAPAGRTGPQGGHAPGAGGFVSRYRPASSGRGGDQGGGLHQPDPGPPRLSRHDGRVPRRQDAPVRGPAAARAHGGSERGFRRLFGLRLCLDHGGAGRDGRGRARPRPDPAGAPGDAGGPAPDPRRVERPGRSRPVHRGRRRPRPRDPGAGADPGRAGPPATHPRRRARGRGLCGLRPHARRAGDGAERPASPRERQADRRVRRGRRPRPRQASADGRDRRASGRYGHLGRALGAEQPVRHPDAAGAGRVAGDGAASAGGVPAAGRARAGADGGCPRRRLHPDRRELQRQSAVDEGGFRQPGRQAGISAAAPDPVSDGARGAGDGDLDDRGGRDGQPLHQLDPRQAGPGPADPRRRPGVPPVQGRHPDHGRADDPGGHRRGRAAVGRPDQPLYLDRLGRDGGLRRAGLHRRLRQGDEADLGRADVQAEAAGPDDRGGDRRRADHLDRLPLPEGGAAEHRLVLCGLCGLHHHRLLERGEPDGRAGRPGHRAGDDGGGRLRHHQLPGRQLPVRGLFAGPPCARRGRTGHLLRRHHRRGHGLPVVQRPAGQDLHGRHRLAGPGRHAGRGCGCNQTRNRIGNYRRPVRDGSVVGDYSGWLVQADRQARVPDGADPSPF
uniref:LigA n=1 Tax=Parastrongyloides trichosuri TaxID=131310 RepID=A0A0N5A0A2_PARTI